MSTPSRLAHSRHRAELAQKIVPGEAVRQLFEAGEFQVQHSAMAARSPPTTLRWNAKSAAASPARRRAWAWMIAGSSAGATASLPKRCEPGNAQRPIFVGHFVQMDSQREHLLQQRQRSLDVRYAGLERWLAELPAGQTVVANGDRQILVPGQRPGAIGRLVEKQHAHQAKVRPQHGGEQIDQSGRGAKPWPPPDRAPARCVRRLPCRPDCASRCADRPIASAADNSSAIAAASAAVKTRRHDRQIHRASSARSRSRQHRGVPCLIGGGPLPLLPIARALDGLQPAGVQPVALGGRHLAARTSRSSAQLPAISSWLVQ